MADATQTCSSDTDGLILSSYQVLQDCNGQQGEGRQQLKLESNPFSGDHDLTNHQNDNGLNPHQCNNDAAEGDEMFDVTDNDHFRGDEVEDSLDNGTNNNSLDREDEGDDEEEDEEEEDEEEDEEDGRVVGRRDNMQDMPQAGQDVSADQEGEKRECTTSEMRAHHPRREGFVDMAASLGAHGFIDSSRGVWQSNPPSPKDPARYQANWHISLASANSGATRDRTQDVLSDSSSPEESRNGGGDEKHWKFVHGQHTLPNEQHQHWGPEQAQGKVVVGAGNQNWVAPKREMLEERTHDMQGMHHHGNMAGTASLWSPHMRAGQPNVTGHVWHKDMGGVFAAEGEINPGRNLFTLQPAQSGIAGANVNNSYSEMPTNNNGSWNLGGHGHLPPGPAMGAVPRPIIHHDLSCRRAGPPGFYHQGPAQGFTSYQNPGGDRWPPTAMSPGPSGLAPDASGEHFKVSGAQPGLLCKSSILNKRGKGRGVRGALHGHLADSHTPSKSRISLDQVRHQSHPYQMKDQKKVVRDVYPATSANVHTLKASHIVSWYIDYLIHENEHLTQISRAFSLPVNLFHSDDFYFMESLKKKVHFPSLKFLSWMQQNLPSINVNAVDFHEGRPPVVSTWNQDWLWQNKSRRDIIHDVFFYFQHRRVTCEN